MKRWKWWQSGLFLGGVSWLSVFLYKPISVSSGYVYIDRLLGGLLIPDFVTANPYFASYQRMDFWLLGLLLGLFIAGVVEKRDSGTVHRDRGIGRVLLGGAIMLFGARLAGGCTSGHMLGGLTMLSVSGLVFAVGVFLGGIPAAIWLAKGRRVR